MDATLKHRDLFIKQLVRVHAVCIATGLLTVLIFRLHSFIPGGSPLDSNVTFSDAAASLAVLATLAIALHLLIAPTLRHRNDDPVDLARAHIVESLMYAVTIISFLITIAYLAAEAPSHLPLEMFVLLCTSVTIAVFAVDLTTSIPEKSSLQLRELRTAQKLEQMTLAVEYWSNRGELVKRSLPRELAALFAGLLSISTVVVLWAALSYALDGRLLEPRAVGTLAVSAVFMYGVWSLLVYFAATSLACRDAFRGVWTACIGVLVALFVAYVGYQSIVAAERETTAATAILVAIVMTLVFGPLCLVIVGLVPPRRRGLLDWIRTSALRQVITWKIRKSISATNQLRTRASGRHRIVVTMLAHLRRAAGETK